MPKACIFSHFYDKPEIPYYVRVYLHSLIQYFDQIILVTNAREILNAAEIESQNIKIKKVKNQGYDLGMFYQGYQSLDISTFDAIACINDSNILFGSLKPIFEWARTEPSDFWGLIDSSTKPSYTTHDDSYHIQSHFMVFNKKTIDLLPTFFETIPWNEINNGKSVKEIKQKVINHWEIGLSQYLISKGLKIKSFVDHKTVNQKYAQAKDSNSSLVLFDALIHDGYPLIKKKIITAHPLKYLFSRKSHWKKLIKAYAMPAIDLNTLIKELFAIRWRHYKNKVLKIFKPT